MSSQILIALAGGLLTILAPCAAMLIPAFFAYAFSSRTTLLARTGLFFLGLVVALVPLGVAAGSIGAVLITHRDTIAKVAAIAIILLGIVQALSLRFPHLRLPWSQPSGDNAASPVAVFMLGVGYGLAGAGCTGPILGVVLLLSAQAGTVIGGGLLMAAYAAGMFTPVLVLALVWDALDVSGRAWLRPRPMRFLGRDTTVGNVISGTFCVILGGLLFTTGGTFDTGVLSADSQAALESRVLEAIGAAPALPILMLVVAAVAISAIVLVLLRRPKAKTSSPPAE